MLMNLDNMLKVSITGIDGAGKDTVSRSALEGISNTQDLTVVKLGRPAYRIVNGEVTQIFRRTTEAIDRLHEISDEVANTKLITASNALNMVIQTRVMERASVADDAVDILASSRDPRLDPAVYYDFYGGKSSEYISMQRRARLMQRLTNISRDLIIYLEVDPELAVARIDARIAAENAGNDTTMRPKWKHVHENIHDLASLAAGYDTALSTIDFDGADIVRIDTNDKTRAQVIEETQQTILDAYRSKQASI